MLWEHRGVTQLDQDLSEGAIFTNAWVVHITKGVINAHFNPIV